MDAIGPGAAKVAPAGTEPANPSPGYENCNTKVAAVARVTASRAAGGSSSQAVADSTGRDNLRLNATRWE